MCLTTMLLGSNGLKRALPGRCEVGPRLRLRSHADTAEVAGRGGERVTSLSSNESRRTLPPSVGGRGAPVSHNRQRALGRSYIANNRCSMRNKSYTHNPTSIRCSLHLKFWISVRLDTASLESFRFISLSSINPAEIETDSRKGHY